MAVVMDVLSRNWSKIADFDPTKNVSCGPSRQSAAIVVLQEKGWTLFSFDFAHQQAVFLDVGEACDLSKSAFAYSTQFEMARRMALLGFDEVLALTENLPDVPRLVQLFNTGHCGSTLLHHVLNKVPGVWCVSEPVAFINLAMNRQTVDSALLQNLARAVYRLLMFFPGAGAGGHVVVKHFSQSTAQLTLLHAVQPQGHCVFLYRDALSWANSLYHFAQKHGATIEIPKDKRRFTWGIMSGNEPVSYLDGYVDMDGEVVTFDAFAAMAWRLNMQQFAAARQDGVPLFPLRYNELVAHRTERLGQLFQHLNLPDDAIAGTFSAFETDSHEGTKTARSSNDLHFAPENYARIKAMLARSEINLDPDLILSVD